MPERPKSLGGLNDQDAVALPAEDNPNAAAPSAETNPEVFANARRWQTIWPQVIAMAWADDKYREKLKRDPRGTIEGDFKPFKLSQELKLIIADAEIGTYDPTIPLVKDRWTDLPPMELKLFIPPKPEELKDQAIAVTHYGETGRTYPMTSG